MQNELWQGAFSATKVDLSDLPALVFWVHLFGILKGGREHFTLIAPDKLVLIDTEKPLIKNNKSWVSYIGKRNTIDNQLSKGEWRGTYQLKSEDKVLINVVRAFVVE